MKHAPSILATAFAALAIGSSAQQAPRPAPPVPAQAIVGSTAKVDGLVTVSFGSQVATVVNESPVIDRSRYVTSSSGRVTLNFKDGCEIVLQPNRALQIDGEADCDKRIAMIQILSDSSEVAGLFGGNNALPALGVALLLGGVAAGGGNSTGGASTGPVQNPNSGGGGLPVGPTPIP